MTKSMSLLLLENPETAALIDRVTKAYLAANHTPFRYGGVNHYWLYPDRSDLDCHKRLVDMHRLSWPLIFDKRNSILLWRGLTSYSITLRWGHDMMNMLIDEPSNDAKRIFKDLNLFVDLKSRDETSVHYLSDYV